MEDRRKLQSFRGGRKAPCHFWPQNRPPPRALSPWGRTSGVGPSPSHLHDAKSAQLPPATAAASSGAALLPSHWRRGAYFGEDAASGRPKRRERLRQADGPGTEGERRVPPPRPGEGGEQRGTAALTSGRGRRGPARPAPEAPLTATGPSADPAPPPGAPASPATASRRSGTGLRRRRLGPSPRAGPPAQPRGALVTFLGRLAGRRAVQLGGRRRRGAALQARWGRGEPGPRWRPLQTSTATLDTHQATFLEPGSRRGRRGRRRGGGTPSTALMAGGPARHRRGEAAGWERAQEAGGARERRGAGPAQPARTSALRRRRRAAACV